MRYRTAFGIGLASGALIAIPLFSVWQAWIFQFQTLITGIAAVAAASFAVKQSQLAEREQGRRHSELVSQSLRPDRLRIERMLFPTVGIFPDYENYLSGQMEAMKSLSEAELHKFFNSQEAEGFVDAFSDLRRDVHRRVFDDARDLFTAEVEFVYGELTEHLDQAEDTIQMLRQGVRVARNGEHVNQGEVFRAQMEAVLIHLRNVYEAFSTMAAEYKLKL